MSLLLVILMLILGAGIVATLCAVIVRPGVFDRIIGIGILGTKTTILLALIGALFGRVDAFVDLALTYALLNFVLTLAVAKYFTRWEAAP
jgi:multicomponent Na+:H+ antiporter subunit F